MKFLFVSLFKRTSHLQWVVERAKNNTAPSKEVNRMYEAQKKHGTDKELFNVLTAISVVSRRLAMKLALIQSQSIGNCESQPRKGRQG